MDLFICEYPGYRDEQSTNVSTVEEFEARAKRIVTFMVEELKRPVENLILIGASIGCSAALVANHFCQLQYGTDPAGLILLSPFSSIEAIAADIYSKAIIGSITRMMVKGSGIDLRPLMRNDYLVKFVRCPLLIHHETRDPVVGVEHSRRLFDLCPLEEPMKLLCTPAFTSHSLLAEMSLPVTLKWSVNLPPALPHCRASIAPFAAKSEGNKSTAVGDTRKKNAAISCNLNTRILSTVDGSPLETWKGIFAKCRRNVSKLWGYVNPVLAKGFIKSHKWPAMQEKRRYLLSEDPDHIQYDRALKGYFTRVDSLSTWGLPKDTWHDILQAHRPVERPLRRNKSLSVLRPHPEKREQPEKVRAAALAAPLPKWLAEMKERLNQDVKSTEETAETSVVSAESAAVQEVSSAASGRVFERSAAVSVGDGGPASSVGCSEGGSDEAEQDETEGES